MCEMCSRNPVRATIGVLFVFLAQLAMGALPVAAEAPAPTRAERDAMVFRVNSGLPSDLGYIRSLAADPSTSNNDFGLALTAGELADLRSRPTGKSLRALRDFLGSRPGLSGGVFIDQAARGVVDVAVTVQPSATLVADLRAQLPPNATLRVRQVAHAEADLRALQDRLAADGTARTPLGRLIASVSTDVRANTVKVGAKPENVDALRAALIATGAAGMYTVHIAEVPQDTADTTCTRDDCRSPLDLRGGLKIFPGWCTHGFVVKSGTNFLGTTAGHCGTIGTNWTHGGEAIGTTTKQSDFQGSDADALIFDSPNTRASTCIYIDPNASDCFNIRSVQQLADDAVGDEVRQSGATTGREIGYVTDTDWDGNFGCCFYNNLIRANYNNDFGDSGAPVYQVNGAIAVGLNKGRFGDYNSIYSHMRYVQSRLGVTTALCGC
jgi:hypothetical protein